MRQPGKIAAIAMFVMTIAACSSGSGGSGSSAGSGDSGGSLTARTDSAGVELLEQEAFDTHIHTQLEVKVNGGAMDLPAGIGIDEDAGRIAALHSHDTDGLIHVESPQKNAKYTLDQFLTVWGMPAAPAARCAFFDAAPPCTLTVTSKDSGAVGLDVTLVDEDTLTLTVTSE